MCVYSCMCVICTTQYATALGIVWLFTNAVTFLVQSMMPILTFSIFKVNTKMCLYVCIYKCIFIFRKTQSAATLEMYDTHLYILCVYLNIYGHHSLNSKCIYISNFSDTIQCILRQRNNTHSHIFMCVKSVYVCARERERVNERVRE